MTRDEAIQFIDGIIVDIKSQTFAANMVRANGKPISTARLTYRNFRRLQALEMAKNALMGSEKSPEGCPENCTDEKQGEWVVCGDGERVPFICTHCGKTTSWYHKQTAKYCPNCGARMKGE